VVAAPWVKANLNACCATGCSILPKDPPLPFVRAFPEGFHFPAGRVPNHVLDLGYRLPS
jgi:hypothetical protein